VALIGRREKEGQSRFFRQVLQHPISQQFPPAEEYTLRVLRLYYAAIDELYLEYDEEMIRRRVYLPPRAPDAVAHTDRWALAAAAAGQQPCHRTLVTQARLLEQLICHLHDSGPSGLRLSYKHWRLPVTVGS
jgi:hypothetical protein